MGARSHIFDVWRILGTALEEAPWPAHEVTGHGPEIDVPEASESITLRYRVEDDAALQWERVGGNSPRGERFTVEIFIRTQVPLAKRLDCINRLEVLHDVAHELFQDPETGAWRAPWSDESWAVQIGGVQRVLPRIQGGPEGYAGECLISVQVAVRDQPTT